MPDTPERDRYQEGVDSILSRLKPSTMKAFFAFCDGEIDDDEFEQAIGYVDG